MEYLTNYLLPGHASYRIKFPVDKWIRLYDSNHEPHLADVRRDGSELVVDFDRPLEMRLKVVIVD